MKTIEKQQAISLRHQGLSYREILYGLPVSPGSLSRWLRDIELTEEQHTRIHQQNLTIRRAFVEWNHRHRTHVRAQKAELIKQRAGTVGELTPRELTLIGAALYWAEGCKSPLTSGVEFVNADPAMIGLMMRWFRECCRVPESKFRARAQLHDPQRLHEVQRYWSQVTGVPVTQFTKPILKLSSSSQRKRGNSLPYGTAHIRIADVHLLTIIRGWIAGLGLAPSSSPA